MEKTRRHRHLHRTTVQLLTREQFLHWEGRKLKLEMGGFLERHKGEVMLRVPDTLSVTQIKGGRFRIAHTQAWARGTFDRSLYEFKHHEKAPAQALPPAGH